MSTGSASTAPPDPRALRAEIARTRIELGETIEALAAKTRLTARARRAFTRDARRMARRPWPVATAAAAGALLIAAVITLAARRRRG